MIRTIILFLVFWCTSVFSQNIGIVYNINPKMGFAVNNSEFFNSGVFLNKDVTNEKDTNYNFINFIENYYKNKNPNSNIYDNFDFLQVKYINNSEDINYIQKFCLENKIDELIIITKNYSYIPYDPMEAYKYFDHDLGIVSNKKFFYKATLYGNFYIFSYTKKNNKVEKKINNSLLIPRRFNQSVFNRETFELQNDDVLKYYIPELEKYIIKKLEK